MIFSGQFGCVYEGKLSRGPRSSNDYGSLTHEHVAIKTIKGISTVLLRHISSYYVNTFSDSGMNIFFIIHILNDIIISRHHVGSHVI